jgi:N-acetylglucosaminyl-diphospho-decaprenol L-rhamnosyltransferase
MRISAIIVTHNSARSIASALFCLAPDKLERVFVVDNASNDDSGTIARQYAHVTLIRNDHNEGFGRACNRALAQVDTEFVLFLNPDATITASDMDQILACFKAHPKAAIIGPAFDKTGNTVMPTRFVSGAIAMWRMEHMRKVGFFDPAFFLFFEDDDICLRVLNAGYELFLLSNLQATHRAGTSCEITPELESLKLQASTWSKLYFSAKYKNVPAAYMQALLLYLRGLFSGNKGDAEMLREQAIERHEAELAKAKVEYDAKGAGSDDWSPLVAGFEKRWAKIHADYEARKQAGFAKDRAKGAYLFLISPKRCPLP